MALALPLLQPAPAANAAPKSVRISLTDRCDLACVYCRPHRHDGYADERLDVDAWKSMVLGLVEAGIKRVRLTGGEPLLHPQVVDMVGFLARLPIEDLALTTNATQLAHLAQPLRDAGLMRLNISIDTLDEARFRRITRGGDLRTVLSGIDAAFAAGFSPIKLNTVVVRGENDDELETLTRWAWERHMVPRFLEVMMIGDGATLSDRVVTGKEMRMRLTHLLRDDAASPEVDRGPAKYVHARGDTGLKVGFITGTSDTYCAGCDRLRISSDGTLRPCLSTNDGVSASHAARANDLTGVRKALDEAWAKKPDGATWKGCTEKTAAEVSIRAIGG